MPLNTGMMIEMDGMIIPSYPNLFFLGPMSLCFITFKVSALTFMLILAYSHHEYAPSDKPLFWVGSSLKDLRVLPEEVKDEVRFALYQVQRGFTPRSAKALRGFGGASVLEIVEDFKTDTYRAVYTVQFADAVYVLHVIQKIEEGSGDSPV